MEIEEFKKEKYKRTTKIASVIGICKALKIITMCVIIFFVIGMTTTIMDKHLSMNVLIFVAIIFGVNVLIYLAADKEHLFIENADLYVNNFREDIDGIIKLSDLAFYVAQDEATIIKNFSKLVAKGYIINCKIERKNNINYIVLDNSILKQSMKQSEEVKEIVLNDIQDFNKLKHYKCPNCGGSIKINDINNVVCDYCRTRLIFQKQKDTPLGNANIQLQNKKYVNYNKTIIQLLVAAASMCFFTVFTIAGIGAYIENSSEISRTYTMSFVFMVFIILGQFMVARSVRKFIKFNTLSMYSFHMRGTNSGIIEIKDFAKRVNKPEQHVIKNIIILIKEGYLINCRLERQNGKCYLVLNNELKESIKEDTKLKEIVLKDIEEYNSIQTYPCPTCGATINIKDKENVVCDYCRTRLHFKRLVDNKTKKA